MEKIRIDRLLIERGLAETREKAKALLMSGVVIVDGKVVEKAGAFVPRTADIRIKAGLPYVSRGGIKLENALGAFSVDVKGFVCIDVGASTGGFTDCLLKHGARKVYAVDVGRGQLDWKLRNDPRVVVLEGVNARYLSEREIPEKVDLAVIDVSFISLTKILSPVKELLKENGFIIALIKPQFELTKKEVSRGKGVVKDPALHFKAVKKILDFSREIGLYPEKLVLAEPAGAKGNREFFVLLSKDPSSDKIRDRDIKTVTGFL